MLPLQINKLLTNHKLLIFILLHPPIPMHSWLSWASRSWLEDEKVLEEESAFIHTINRQFQLLISARRGRWEVRYHIADYAEKIKMTVV